ncbi:M50 family metallopeptidase [Rhodococcus erythropolis]|jgi:membrane-associated protease RseP (regulator of RpoE activity)|uniref:M50 family metallopeptidase n=1 Tax=Rhodococcus erythropolis TaxID=1833 RepID=UPI00083F9CE1|nr:site-2 protease family protein [Rhodococcus erythropolis]MCD2157158.1 site-2 protease family protein [Rhodococcus cerastii]MDF2471351.1 putative family peptidase [Rhodococcus erythropolis]OFV73374.1 zinc metalloprotease Rip1 [Rhodococcus erythropolis]
MVFALGVVLFALGIGVSIALHEAGHMWTAKALGMKVRRYYIGFGPKIFSFRRGETEYGLKALPLGGFCDIAGMTALDEMTPEEEPHAMYKKAAWKRVVVMSGGIAMNFILGFLLIYALLLGWGRTSSEPAPPVVKGVTCVAPTQLGQDQGWKLADCTGTGPAEAAGIAAGDRIVAVDGQPTDTFAKVSAAIRDKSGTVTLTVERGDETVQVPVDVSPVERYVAKEGSTTPELAKVGAVGIEGVSNLIEYNALTAVPAAFDYTGQIMVDSVKALADIPSKVGALWESITGGERALDTPISVVGASVIGGEAADRAEWPMFVGLLASINFFLGVFNILPLLPLDGGHIAVVFYEKIRDWFRARRGLIPGGPVDYTRLLPITYVFIVIGGAFMLLTLTADIVNPIKIF